MRALAPPLLRVIIRCRRRSPPRFSPRATTDAAFLPSFREALDFRTWAVGMAHAAAILGPAALLDCEDDGEDDGARAVPTSSAAAGGAARPPHGPPPSGGLEVGSVARGYLMGECHLARPRQYAGAAERSGGPGGRGRL